LACAGITKLAVADGDGDAVADGTAVGDDAADDAVALGVALAVEAPTALYPVPAGAGDAATMLAIHSPIPRTAPASKVTCGDLSFMFVVRPCPASGSLSATLEA
jgi:hypothetical protein